MSTWASSHPIKTNHLIFSQLMKAEGPITDVHGCKKKGANTWLKHPLVNVSLTSIHEVQRCVKLWKLRQYRGTSGLSPTSNSQSAPHRLSVTWPVFFAMWFFSQENLLDNSPRLPCTREMMNESQWSATITDYISCSTEFRQFMLTRCVDCGQ